MSCHGVGSLGPIILRDLGGMPKVIWEPRCPCVGRPGAHVSVAQVSLRTVSRRRRQGSARQTAIVTTDLGYAPSVGRDIGSGLRIRRILGGLLAFNRGGIGGR